MAEYDLRGAHISCLYYLFNSDGLTATDLCERCEEDKATISRALEHLEKGGYLVRAPIPAKRYKSSLVLTETGRKVGRQITEKIDRVLCEVSAALNEEERIAFYRSLQIISDRLDTIASASEQLTETQESSHEHH